MLEIIITVAGSALVLGSFFYFKKPKQKPETSVKDLERDLGKNLEKERTLATPPSSSETNKIFDALLKTRENIKSSLGELLFKKSASSEEYEQLLDALILSDISVKTAEKILENVKKNPSQTSLSQKVVDEMDKMIPSTSHFFERIKTAHKKPYVAMFLGVNGSGKTTTIGKLGYLASTQHQLKTLLVAGDTFRAAAMEQLKIWAERCSCEIFAKPDVSPSALIFDALSYAQKNEFDLVLIDTAGRLQTKIPLMEELAKINRTIQKVIPEAPHESILVVDSTTGQNGLSQARNFNEAVKLNYVALTKLDGTSKGGIALTIVDEIGIPITLIGVGEKPQDLQNFNSKQYTQGILGLS